MRFPFPIPAGLCSEKRRPGARRGDRRSGSGRPQRHHDDQRHPIRAEDETVESVLVTLQDLAPLEELERLRSEFLGMISHELRPR